MSRVCGVSLTCPFAPEQTTCGCPCAELCPGFVEPTQYRATTTTFGNLAHTVSNRTEEVQEADILIRGMEMPKTCADCHDADFPTAIAWLGAKCPWSNGIIDPGVYDLRHDRHPDCPLVELPPHGDLIDKQATFKALSEKFKSSDGFVSWTDAIDIVLRAQEIVPSNKEETE